MSKSGAWPRTLIRGLIALALGLFLLFSPQTAPIWVIYALAIYMALAGGLQTFSGLMNRNAPGGRTDLIRGLVGLVGGAALLLMGYFDVLTVTTLFTILAVALILYGVLGLFEALFARGAERFQWMPLFVNVLLVLLGVLIFYSRQREFDLRLWSGAILTLMGLGLAGFALFVQRRRPAVAVSGA
jgi:uncharacterized membrane protein HdeD (DUF308 family)